VRTASVFSSDQNSVECTVPAWPAAAGTVSGMWHNASLKAVVSGMLHNASLKAGVPATFTITGAGFAAVPYSLQFNSTSSTNESSSAPCVLQSSTLLACSGVWPHAYATTIVTLIQYANTSLLANTSPPLPAAGGSPVHVRAPLGVYFSQYWETLLSALPGMLEARGGDVVTVVGGGFGDASGYACVVSAQGGNVSVVSPARPGGVSQTEVTCDILPWIAEAGTARFSLLHLGSEVPATAAPAGEFDHQDLTIRTNVAAFIPAVASSLGSEPIQHT
ncbi:hypothetical protein T484DRAFT_1814216, partial [Baffinella frigidus]